jgi:hypothetical protein
MCTVDDGHLGRNVSLSKSQARDLETWLILMELHKTKNGSLVCTHCSKMLKCNVKLEVEKVQMSTASVV